MLSTAIVSSDVHDSITPVRVANSYPSSSSDSLASVNARPIRRRSRRSWRRPAARFNEGLVLSRPHDWARAEEARAVLQRLSPLDPREADELARVIEAATRR
jgi:hypothetical protein